MGFGVCFQVALPLGINANSSQKTPKLLQSARSITIVIVYRNVSFPSKESDNKDPTEHIVRLQGKHHQLLFKWNFCDCAVVELRSNLDVHEKGLK